MPEPAPARSSACPPRPRGRRPALGVGVPGALLLAAALPLGPGCDEPACPPGSEPEGGRCVATGADAGPAGDPDAGGTPDGGGCGATPDPIDAAGEDTNCDGVDGVAAATVFVAPGAADAGDGTPARPVATLARALELASDDRSTILLAAGSLSGPLALRPGLAVHGGYGEGFVGPRARTEIAGPGPVLVGRDLGEGAGVHVSRIDVRADDAVTAGGPSVAAWFTDTGGVLLEAVRLVAGRAADGRDGDTPGAAADGGPGADGGSGVVLGEPAWCPEGSRPFLFAPVPTPGGEGDCCGGGGQGNGSGRAVENGPGQGGEAGMLRGGACTGDRLDNGGAAGLPAAKDGGDGDPGVTGQAGAVGRGGAGTGRFGPDAFVPADGEPGGRGEAGSGGGGGGGGEGCPTDGLERCWVAGGGGGGGGAGGCGGLGGGPGGGGGASVALWLWRSEVRLVEVVLEAGPGGDGGAGAVGGDGGRGGEGGAGGARATAFLSGSACSATGAGGAGGSGGAGGPGGGGGGGAGGPSVALLLGDASALGAGTRWLEYATAAPGAGGPGGEGFASARGADGLAFDTLVVGADGTPD